MCRNSCRKVHIFSLTWFAVSSCCLYRSFPSAIVCSHAYQVCVYVCVCVVSFTCAALPACVKMQKMFFFSFALCRFAFCVDFAATYFCLIKYFVSNQRILLAFCAAAKGKSFSLCQKKENKRKRKSEKKDCCELWFCLCNFNNQLHTALLSIIECVWEGDGCSASLWVFHYLN